MNHQEAFMQIIDLLYVHEEYQSKPVHARRQKYHPRKLLKVFKVRNPPC